MVHHFRSSVGSISALLLGLTSISFGAGGQDLGPTLSLADSIRLALTANPEIATGIHSVRGSEANLSGQRQPLNPSLVATAVTNTPGTFVQNDATQFGVLFTVETSGRQAIRTRLAKAQLEGQKEDFQTTRQTLVQNVTDSYIQVQLAERSLEIEQAAYTDAKFLNDLADQQFKLGSAPETNSIRSSIALAQEEQALEQAKTQIPLQKASLNVQLGRPAEAPIEISEPLAFHKDTRDLNSLQKIALAKRPEVLSAIEAKKALQAQVDFQHSQYVPDVTIGADPYAVGHGQIELIATVPLFDFGSLRGALKEARENVKAQDAQIDQVKSGVLLDVRTAYLNLLQAQKLVDTFNQGILSRSQQLLDKVFQGYKLGASTILDVLDAESTHRSVETDYANAVANYGLAVAQLDRAVGASPDPNPVDSDQSVGKRIRS